jgi:hypothetical protein
MGPFSIVILYLIDSTFIELGAFSYSAQILSLSGISIFYLLSSFPGGILLVYYYPKNKKMQVPYILLAAFIFLLMELIMMWAGYFQYVHWNSLKSYLLDIFGFTVVLWFAEWSGKAGKGK